MRKEIMALGVILIIAGIVLITHSVRICSYEPYTGANYIDEFGRSCSCQKVYPYSAVGVIVALIGGVTFIVGGYMLVPTRLQKFLGSENL